MINWEKTKGSALIIAVMLMSMLMILSSYFLNISLNEKKISAGQTLAGKAYYLAEAGVSDAVWRLKNDQTYKDSFENNPAWTVVFSKNNPFGTSSGSYEVSIINDGLAHGQITSTGQISAGGKIAKRVIKTYVYKALGQTGIQDSTGYADGNIDISGSIVNFYNGSAHSNNIFNINNGSSVSVDSDLRANGNFIKSWTASTSIAGTIYAANYPPAAEKISMPAIDFNSTATSSYKNRASVVYTEQEFSDLMWNNQNLVLNDPITYVRGDVELRGGQTLTTNGLLVVENDLHVGARSNWGGRSGKSSLTVNHATGTPAGILAGRHININDQTNNINIQGLVYAVDQLNISGLEAGGSSFNVFGALVSRKLTITSCWQSINITRDNDILLEIFEATEYSPTVIVEHWEEEY